MGLTKPRAYQIYDIDYKQSVRVITTTNITLSGGAPTLVDGVTLSLNDRVLVTGQTTGSQNGIYYVSTLGSGSNGTWTRSTDTDVTGELLAGTIVMVTEGTVYHDTQWKLTTNDPIVIGTTALTFEQNSAYAFGNVYANGTAVLATAVGDVLTLTAGNNISITGNNTSKTVTIGVTGISLNSISNGTSNVNVVSSGGNVTVGVGGTSNVLVLATTGEYVTGVMSASGNITGGNLLTGGLISATSTITSAANITGGNLLTGGLVSATANVTGGNLLTGGLVSATSTITSAANITGGNLLTGGLLSATGNVTGGNVNTAGLITATGNITGGNILTAGIMSSTGNATHGNILTGGLISATSTITSAANITGGNLLTGGLITATGNITGGNVLTGGLISATSTITSAANITGGNLLTGGLISATGNVTGGNLLIGGIASVTGNVLVGNINTLSQGSVRYFDNDNTNWVAFKAPLNLNANITWTWPTSDGTSSQVLTTDGAGTLSWSTGGGSGGTGGYNNSTLTAFPGSAGNANYGNGETYVGEATTTDAFGVSIIPTFSCMDPLGSLQGPNDLGVLP